MKRFPIVVALLAMVAACSDSESMTGPDEVTIEDLVGSWTASSHAFTNNANGGEAFDLIAYGGETRVTVLTGGRARTWVNFGDFSDEWDAQLTVEGGMLISSPAEVARGTRSWAFTLNENVLTLTDVNSEFDFSLSGAPGVSATEVLTLVRQ